MRDKTNVGDRFRRPPGVGSNSNASRLFQSAHCEPNIVISLMPLGPISNRAAKDAGDTKTPEHQTTECEQESGCSTRGAGVPRHGTTASSLLKATSPRRCLPRRKDTSSHIFVWRARYSWFVMLEPGQPDVQHDAVRPVMATPARTGKKSPPHYALGWRLSPMSRA